MRVHEMMFLVPEALAWVAKGDIILSILAWFADLTLTFLVSDFKKQCKNAAASFEFYLAILRTTSALTAQQEKGKERAKKKAIRNTVTS